MQAFCNRCFGNLVLRALRDSDSYRINIVSLKKRPPVFSSGACADDSAAFYRFKSGFQSDFTKSRADNADSQHIIFIPLSSQLSSNPEEELQNPILTHALSGAS